MNRLLLWSLTSALAGFLFGFDTVVISGAEREIQTLWQLGGWLHGLALAAALYGTVLGALFGGWPVDRFGRRGALLSVGILYLVSACWSAAAPNVYAFTAARFLGGIGVGLSTIASPLYISEMAPPERRGRLAGLFQFNIVLGILVAFLSNYLLGRWLGEGAWRWMLGIEALPALVFAVLCWRLPESPRWLVSKRGKREEAAAVLRLAAPASSPEAIEAELDRISDGGSGAGPRGGAWPRQLRLPLLLAIFIALFNQLSGINVILYFAPRLLAMAGIEDALLASVSIGATNLIFTLVGLSLIDRVGRRTLMAVGSVGYVVTLGFCAWAFLSQPEFKVVSTAMELVQAVEQMDEGGGLEGLAGEERRRYEETRQAFVEATWEEGYEGPRVILPEEADPGAVKRVAEEDQLTAGRMLGGLRYWVLLGLMGFIAAHAVGQGAVIWVFIAEIFPTHFRARGQAVGSFTHWLGAALLTQLFPWALGAFEAGYLFLFFCGMMILQGAWVKWMMPETKGVPLEEMQRQLGNEPAGVGSDD